MAAVALAQAKLDLEKTSIHVPYDGWILEKNIEMGQHVSVGQPLGAIYRDQALEVEIALPVAEFQWLETVENGSRIEAEAEIVYMAGDGEIAWKGMVSRTLAHLDETTRTMRLIVDVMAPVKSSSGQFTPLLKPGMFVRVVLTGKKLSGVFSLPRHVVHAGNNVYIYSDHRLVIQPVVVLRSFKDSVIIGKGLSEGDLLIHSPVPGARDGMLLRRQ
jgi:RND family efflux transporter MFP subunit